MSCYELLSCKPVIFDDSIDDGDNENNNHADDHAGNETGNTIITTVTTVSYAMTVMSSGIIYYRKACAGCMMCYVVLTRLLAQPVELA